MDIVNAIAKARFSAAGPQHVQLHRESGLRVLLLCMEPGQEARVRTGQWTYYVVAGSARLSWKDQVAVSPAGQAAISSPDEPNVLANPGEGRLVCLAFARRSCR